MPTDNTAYRYGATVTVADATMTRTGYTFDYWQGSSYQPGDTFVITGAHVLTAQWKANATNPSEPSKPSVPTNPTAPSSPSSPANPPTGDNSLLWIAFLCTSGVGVVGIAVYSKKKRTNKF